MFFADFTMVMMIVFIVSFALTLLLLYWSRILAIIPLLICVFTLGFVVLVFGVFTEDPALSIEPNETRLDTEVLMTEVHIRPLDETPYFLVQENGEYIYRSTDADSKENSKIDASQCEFEFSNKKPGISIQNITTKCRAEWLFLYNVKTKQEQKYLITVPSKESILNLDE